MSTSLRPNAAGWPAAASIGTPTSHDCQRCLLSSPFLFTEGDGGLCCTVVGVEVILVGIVFGGLRIQSGMDTPDLVVLELLCDMLARIDLCKI